MCALHKNGHPTSDIMDFVLGYKANVSDNLGVAFLGYKTPILEIFYMI